jgi:hypothetical protein
MDNLLDVCRLIIQLITQHMFLTGESQSSTVQNGPLGVFRSVGNLNALKLKTQVGEWTVELVSSNPYTLKVTGKTLEAVCFWFMNKYN